MIYIEDAPDGHRVIMEETFKVGSMYYGQRISGKVEIIRWRVVAMKNGRTFILEVDKKSKKPFSIEGFQFHPNMPLYKGANYTIHKAGAKMERAYKKQQAPMTLMKAKILVNKWIDKQLKSASPQNAAEEIVNFLVKVDIWK